MRVVLLGPPGAGKGTQADRIADRFQLVHVATGDILRANVADGTPLGQVAQAYLDSGELVPDDIVVAMMLERLAQPDCAQGFLLDGFPRSVAQARALDRRLAELDAPLDAAINLEVAEQELLHRLARRGRGDDNAETIHHRLQVFASSTRPLLDYYDGQGLLFSVAAVGTIDEVSERILHAPGDVSERVAVRQPTPEGPPSHLRVVLLGPPGADKRTQADRIADRFQLVHVATGDILRANVADGTPLGQVAQAYLDSGELVPDDIVVAMMLERLAQPDCAQGFLLDGFPRSVAQARALDRRLAELDAPLDAAINLEVAEQELLHRLARRGRGDDNAETIHHRLQVFASSTRPLLDYYDGQGLLFSVAAVGTIDEVSERILHALAEVTRRAPSAGSQPASSGSEGVDVS